MHPTTVVPPRTPGPAHYAAAMSWKVAAVVGACAGGVVWVLGRRAQRPATAQEWAAATDTVAPAADPLASSTA